MRLSQKDKAARLSKFTSYGNVVGWKIWMKIFTFSKAQAICQVCLVWVGTQGVDVHSFAVITMIDDNRTRGEGFNSAQDAIKGAPKSARKT